MTDRRTLEGTFALPIVEKSIQRIGRKSVARVLVSVTGDRLPDGSADIDADGEVTDFEAAVECAKTWDGTVKFHHLDAEAGEIGRAVQLFALRGNGTDMVGDFEIDHPIAVRMIEAGVPLEASWRGEYVATTETAKAADGTTRKVRRLFPVRWKEVSLVIAGFPGANRPRSKTLATAVKAAGGSETKPEGKEPNMDEMINQLGAMFAEQGAEAKTAAIVALFGMLSPEEQAAALEGLSAQQAPPEAGEAAESAAPAPEAPAAEAPAEPPAEAEKSRDLAIAEAVKSLGGRLEAIDAKYQSILDRLAEQGEVISKIASSRSPNQPTAFTREAAKSAGPVPGADLRAVTDALCREMPAQAAAIRDAAFRLSHSTETTRKV